MLELTLRSLKIFFRLKSAVFFSLLSVVIIIGLYVVFLGDVWSADYDLPGITLLIQQWLIAGLLSVTSVTATLGAFALVINDRTQRIDRDFLTAPISRSAIIGGYILGAYIVGVSLTVLALILGELYIVFCGGTLLSPTALVQMLAVILLSVLASSTMLFFLVTFFDSQSAFSTAGTIIGTLIGFITGIYLPIGTLPSTVQWLVKLFPLSHAAALMRQILLAEPLAESFTGLPPEALSGFENALGITLTFGDHTATPWFHIGVLLSTAGIFALLSLWRLNARSGRLR